MFTWMKQRIKDMPIFQKMFVICILVTVTISVISGGITYVTASDIILKKTKKGRKYYGCEANPECDFMSWQKPSTERCPKCGGVLLEKGNKLACMDEQCGYSTNKQKI